MSRSRSYSFRNGIVVFVEYPVLLKHTGILAGSI